MSDYEPQAGRPMPDDAVLTDAQARSEAQDTDDALRGLGKIVTDAEDLDPVLAEIAALAKACIPGSEGVGVTLVHLTPGSRQVLAWAVTDAFVREVDRQQYEVCDEGPCLSAMQTGRAVVSGSVGSDARWPRFGGRVARLRIHSALALPLLVRDVVVGALNVYAHERDAFTEHALRIGEHFSVPAAASVHNTRLLHAARSHAEQLLSALTSRAVIDQAIGIVRSRSGGTADEAFDRLRRVSQAENVKLSEVAARIVDEAVRRAHARHSQA